MGYIEDFFYYLSLTQISEVIFLIDDYETIFDKFFQFPTVLTVRFLSRPGPSSY